MHLSTVKVLIDFGIDWPWSSVSFLISNLFVLPNFASLIHFVSVGIYLVRPSPANAPHSTWSAYIWTLICTWTGWRHGPWNSLVTNLLQTIGVLPDIDSAIGSGFYKLLSVFAKLYVPHIPIFYITISTITKTTVKQCSFAFIWLALTLSDQPYF